MGLAVTPMKIFKRAATTLSVVILVTCCGAFMLFGISATGWKALAIPTGSMRPSMSPGSLALVHSVPASSLKVGDIITYTNPLNPKITLSHRIIKEYLLDGKVPTYVTKGDANKSPDIPITIGSIKGKVIWHVQDAGYLLLDAKNPFIILPIVYIAGILITIEEVKRLSDYYKLSQPYRAPGFSVDEKEPNILTRRLGYVTSLTIVFVMVSAVAAPAAFALLRSNTVALVNNRITAAATAPKCSSNTNNNNSININNSSTQSSSTGSATSSGNTTGGSATSGNSSNSNSTTIIVNVNNC